MNVQSPAPGPAFVEGSLAFHGVHGLVDVLAVVGPQRVIRVQARRNVSEIAVLAVHVDELSAVGAGVRRGPPQDA